ncbi:proteasome subunit alpha type-5-like isoform X2 [Styela clava]|uniref:proteasome subunit alpha type-5-like isoform X2 n=1 Tax=Styela clava TaxID=7725 RepID=UPI00193A33F9|nr:proteasome subunit alpha type-5-like isoform X2 [Styela clava]
MFMTRSEYDRGVNTFSPEGRIFQVEYAIEAIKLGSTAIGIRTAEGVVLAVEKRITSPLIEPSSIEKIFEVDGHVGCAMSGLIADSKTMIDKARVEAQSRPFGVALLFAGLDERGPQLYHLDPSGTYILCDAKAIGSASEGAQTSLQEQYHKSMTIKEATKCVLGILKQVMEEKLTETNVEVATVTPDLQFQMLSKTEVEEIVQSL